MKKLTITYDPETGVLNLNIKNAKGGEVVLMLIGALEDFCEKTFSIPVEESVAIAKQLFNEDEGSRKEE